MGITYKDSGVDITAGNEFVDRIKSSVKKTMIKGVISELGGFGGLFELGKYNNPVLVSGTDGVGTKLKLAFMMDKHDTIGIDAVAMCVNDIVVLGAKPLFFLDYLGCGKLYPKTHADVVEGIANGCKESGCALIGGETAEMPGFYEDGEYDIAGFAVGVVEKDEIIDGKNITENDVVIGITSSGIHSNGFSLVRHLFFDTLGWELDRVVPELGNKTLGEVLIAPTKLYATPVLKVLEKVKINGIVHITGGGFTENVPRILPEGYDVEISKDSYEVPAIFKLMQEKGEIADDEMYRTFNMGIGLTLIVKNEDKDTVLETLKEIGEEAYLIGKVVKGKKECRLV